MISSGLVIHHHDASQMDNNTLILFHGHLPKQNIKKKVKFQCSAWHHLLKLRTGHAFVVAEKKDNNGGGGFWVVSDQLWGPRKNCMTGIGCRLVLLGRAP